MPVWGPCPRLGPNLGGLRSLTRGCGPATLTLRGGRRYSGSHDHGEELGHGARATRAAIHLDDGCCGGARAAGEQRSEDSPEGIQAAATLRGADGRPASCRDVQRDAEVLLRSEE